MTIIHFNKLNLRHVSSSISVYICEMRYYVHYLHFSDYCPHLCRHVYHNISAVVRSGLLQVVGMSNLTLYFAYQGRPFEFHEPCLMDISYLRLIFPSESSPLPSPGNELTLFRCVSGSNQRLYPLCHVSLKTSEFLGIINLMSSATIFTSAHIVGLFNAEVFLSGNYMVSSNN